MLRYFKGRPNMGRDFESEFARVAADMLSPHANNLKKTTQKGALSHVAINASIRFGLTAFVAYVAGSIIGSPELSFIPPTTISALLGILEVAKARRSGGHGALLKHYSLLAPTTSMTT